MLALAFLNPLLLWALPLCAVPIVIHILNRRRFQKVPWAAMTFLLAAMKRNRKRLRMEQWLVLLLRTLAVLLLVFLVSRPQLSGGGLLGTKTHHVVLLDDSASMTQRSGSTTLFERAQDRVRLLADDLSQRRSGDLFSVVRLSKAAQPDMWSQRVGPELARRVGTALKELAVGDGSADFGAALRLSIERAREVAEAGRTEFYVVGDRRAFDWISDDDKPRSSVLASLNMLQPDTQHLTVIGVGGQHVNVGIADVRLVDRTVVVGVPAAMAIDVQNYGLDPASATSLSIEVDGQSRIVQTVPALAPGERVAVPIAHTFHQAGFHRIEAQLEATEAYPIDDRRVLALDVRDKSKVLLVDGQPDEEFGETFFLFSAMEMAESGIEPQVISDTMLEEADLSPFDMIWLCNVQAPSAATARRIEEFVANGGGLAIACGALVDVARYNELMWRDGKGVLPLPLGEIAGDPDKPERAVLVQKDHPVCDRVGEVFDLLISNVVMVKRWLTIIEDERHPAAVVARIHDNEGPPLLVTRTFGNGGGEVALFSITADAFWSNLPATDLFVVLANQLHRASARRRDHASNNLLPAAAYSLQLDPGVYRADVTLRSVPGEDERTVTAVEPPPPVATPGAPEGQAPPRPAVRLSLSVPMTDLRHLGAVEVDLLRHDGVTETRMFARNVPLAESRLVGFAESGFQRLYPTDLHERVTFVRDEGGLGSGEGEGETWPLLAAALLAGLLLESLLAWRFGRR